MSVIIRLQNLPWSANAGDIRSFFKGLGIPDGGVHIVGGENGDAFIAFSTDEDARQAMALNGGRLKETQVSLLLSSRAEMQKVIETARHQTISFMAFSNDTTQQTSAQPMLEQKAFPAQAAAAAQLVQPQPPIITSNSLSGILAQQMFQQHQIQFMNTPSVSAMINTSATTKTIPPEANLLNNSKQLANVMGSVNSPRSDDRSSKIVDENRRGSRSRSKSRDRRSRRSRSRDRSSRRRRSRSSERRNDRRRRDRSSERSRAGSSRADRSRSSYDRDHSSSEPSKKVTTSTSKNGNGHNDINVANNIVQPWENQLAAGPAMNFQQPPPQQQPPMGGFPPMGNLPIMNPMVQPPIGQFPFGSPPPMIPPPINVGAAFGNNNNINRNLPETFQSPQFNSAPPAIPVTDDDQRTTVRMQNLDSSLHYSNIRKFFAGLHIPNDGIKILNDEFGKRRGEAVVRFARPLFAQQAILKNGFQYNGVPMQIFLISDEDYNKEVDSYRPPRHVMNSKQEDMYSGISKLNQTNLMGYNNSFNNSGSATNRFARMNDEPLDLDAVYNRTDQFGRRVRTEEELTKKMSEPQTVSTHIIDDDDDVVLVSDSSNVSGCTALLIEDLPSFTSEQDIMKMFSDFTLLHIVLAREPKNFHAYVRFLNKEDAAVALKVKYNHRIGYKQVNVSECMDHVYEQAKAEYSVDPIPIVQAPQSNLTDIFGTNYGSADSDDNNKGNSGKNPRSKLFQKITADSQSSPNNQFNDVPQQSQFKANFSSRPPKIDTPPAMSAVNHSDPRRRKQIEQLQQQQNSNQNISPFGAPNQQQEEKQQSDFGGNQQNQQPPQFQNAGGNQNMFGGPPPNQFGGTINQFDAQTNQFGGQSNQFGGPPNQFNGQQNQFGGQTNRFGGPPNQFGGPPTQFGGPPNQFGGTPNQFGGPPPNFMANNNFNSNNMGGSNQNNFPPHQNRFNDPRNQNQFQDQQHQNQQIFESCFLYVSNLEFRTTEQEIRDWFAEISVFPKAVYQMLNNRGMTNGNSVCQFNSTEDAARGQTKNRMKMRSRMAYVRLMPPSNAAEALATLGVELSPEELAGDNTQNENQQGFNNDDVQHDDDLENRSDEDAGNDRSDEPRKSAIVQNDEPAKRRPNPKNPFMRTPQPEHADDEEGISNDVQNDDDNMDEEDDGNQEVDNNNDLSQNEDDGPMFDNYGNDNDMNNQRNNMAMNRNNQQFTRGRGGRGGNNHNGMMNRNQNNMGPLPPSQRNTNGCIVALRNVPFQANAIDIMRFFNGFQLGADDIIRRYRDDGSPTGDARVCFASPMDANAAVEQCQNGRIMNRVIQMMLFN